MLRIRRMTPFCTKRSFRTELLRMVEHAEYHRRPWLPAKIRTEKNSSKRVWANNTLQHFKRIFFFLPQMSSHFNSRDISEHIQQKIPPKTIPSLGTSKDYAAHRHDESAQYYTGGFSTAGQHILRVMTSWKIFTLYSLLTFIPRFWNKTASFTPQCMKISLSIIVRQTFPPLLLYNPCFPKTCKEMCPAPLRAVAWTLELKK